MIGLVSRYGYLSKDKKTVTFPDVPKFKFSLKIFEPFIVNHAKFKFPKAGILFAG
jgi:hypothetical protein